MSLINKINQALEEAICANTANPKSVDLQIFGTYSQVSYTFIQKQIATTIALIVIRTIEKQDVRAIKVETEC